MKPPTEALAVAGTSVVAGGVSAGSLPPPQAASSAAVASAARVAWVRMADLLSARAGDRRAEIGEGRQQRTRGLDLRPRLVDAVVQVERRRAERHVGRVAGRAELV